MILDDISVRVEVLSRFNRLEWRAALVTVIRAVPSILIWVGLIAWYLN